MEKKSNWYVNQKKFHFIYKTTCLVTNRYYIGMHSTDDLEDGYIGSGTRLARSVRKYSKEQHRCEIIEFLPDREALRLREREIVNEEKVIDQECMNLIMGGGAFDLTQEQYSARNGKCGKINGIKHADQLQARFIKWNKEVSPLRNKELNKIRNQKRIGIPRSPAVKQKISDGNRGSNNSQFGKVWIFHEDMKISTRVPKSEVGLYLFDGWKLGRRIKWIT